MASIIEGQKYALTSPSIHHQMVFVKLTDSALKAIEDYAASVSKGNVSPSFKPSIEFRPNNSQGVITIPNKVNSTENDKQSYNFSVKDVQNDGIQECVQQRRNMSMESLGKIMLRMQIHANDDSYQNTKVKMAVAAEQELKKYNTKVIQSGDPNVGRKVKVKRPFNAKPPFSALNSSNAPSNASSMYKQSPSMPLSSMPRFNKFANTNSTTTNLLKPTTNFNSNSFHTGGCNNNGNAGNALLADASKKTIRENIVNLLALRPMKVSDLLGKVQERVKEPLDKSAFLSLLSGVSCHKEGAYHLNESCWDEVQMDWLHYSKEDRELAQKRNPLMIAVDSAPPSGLKSQGNAFSSGNSISPLSDSSVRSQSSPASVNTSPSLKNSPYNRTNNLKRNEPLFTSNSLKKLKSDNSRMPVTHSNGKSHSSAIVSHSPLDKLNNNLSLSDHESPESRNTFASNSNCYKSSISLIHENSNHAIKKNDNSTDGFLYGSRGNSYQRISGGNGSGSINSTPNSSPDSGISHVGNILSSDSSANNDADDYLSKYSKIQSNEQLAQYRGDFYAEYPEYRRLYDYVEGVSRQFEELRELILSKDEESDEWHELIRQTIEKYDEVKHKSRYNKAQKRLNYLHFKLMHIKNLINDYNRNNDNKVMVSLSRFGPTSLKS